MINYQSTRPSTNFLMIDKNIDDALTPDANYLFIKLMKLAPKEDNSNENLKKKTGFSKRRFDRAKKELVTKGFLDTKQLYANYYAFYIGQESVKRYRKSLKSSSYNRYEQNVMRKINEKNSDGAKTKPSKS